VNYLFTISGGKMGKKENDSAEALKELFEGIFQRLNRLEENEPRTHVREVVEKSPELPSLQLSKRKVGVSGEVIESSDFIVSAKTPAECFSFIKKLRDLK